MIARDRGPGPETWLVLAAATAQLPLAGEVRRLARLLERGSTAVAHRALMSAVMRNPGAFASPVPGFRIVSGDVVDVDFSATTRHNTGVQRVVRQTVTRWSREHPVVPVAWTSGSESLRDLTPSELRRVIDWEGSATEAEPSGEPEPARVVPFGSTVVLFEVAQLERSGPLAALAEFSGNEVVIVGHDAIPVVSADAVPEAETERYVHFLSVVKHARRLAGVSASATEEYAGFVSALPAQGLRGPETVEVLLPVDLPQSSGGVGRPVSEEPLVLCVGSHEPRKNQFALLHAAETLWREGLRFRLRLIGGGSAWYIRTFDRAVHRLQRAGRAVEIVRGASDDELLESYRSAAFTVFPSLHEGYGLPVAESLALGVPVITTAYGSTAEIAANGGCLLVDPREDDEIVAAMRTLLTDPAELERLRSEIVRRPNRTWDDYATELWDALVEPTRGAR